ncbi:unnamed protein product [Trichogramma brassicae]|uniref:JmjC domain-containing protein n=1 Tax=Trichogramma brassicae TaxID=86971 RepID=A0A6H5IYD1_9HYME|nr:unnamed protein product [Trichogramma brassicae]
MEEKGAHLAGIAKIIPPAEWEPRKSGYKDLGDIIIKRPIVQTVEGSKGVYKTYSTPRKAVSVEKFEVMCKENVNILPEDDAARSYWRSLEKPPRCPPVYGAGVAKSITDSDCEVFNCSKLGTILDEYHPKIEGVHTPYLYFGMYRSMFPWHTEDMDLYSINLVHYGAAKTWYSIPTIFGRKFEQLAASIFPNEAAECQAFLRHKTTLIAPEILEKYGIPCLSTVQNEKEIIITFPYGYHAGFNNGFNCAESVNFASERWIDYAKRATLCCCQPKDSTVCLDMDHFVKKYQPDRYEKWLAGEDDGRHPEHQERSFAGPNSLKIVLDSMNRSFRLLSKRAPDDPAVILHKIMAPYNAVSSDSLLGDKNNAEQIDRLGQVNFEKLKSLREKVNWEIEEERLEFFNELKDLLRKWEGRLPNFLDIFRPEEIDWLLSEVLRNYAVDQFRSLSITEFLIETGYKDQPSLDEDGKPILRRTTAVHWADKIKLRDYGRHLFDKIYNRFDVNYIDESGYTHFHIACRNGYTNHVGRFLESGQDPNIIVESTGDSPLHFALNWGYKNVAMMLLKKGADVNLANRDGITALHLISKPDHFDSSNGFFKIPTYNKKLFKIIEDRHQSMQVQVRDNSGRTPLEWAVAGFIPEAVDAFLEHGADLSSFVFPTESQFEERLKLMGETNGTGFKLRLVCGVMATFECLNKRGYELDRNDAWTIMKFFINYKVFRSSSDQDKKFANEDSVDLEKRWDFRDYDAFYDVDDGDDLIESFFKICDEKNQPVRIDTRDESGNTLLHWAMRHAYKKTSELLLRRGADPNSTNADGCTALHVVCRFYYEYDLTKMLFELSNDEYQPVRLDVRDNLGNTPLHVALEWGGKEVPLMLLERGADINLANEDGATPLHVICESEFDDNGDFVRAFFKIIEDERRSVRVNAQNKFGDTPLHLALVEKHKKLVKLLLENDADANLANAEGSTALHVACHGYEQDDLAEMLFEFSNDKYRPLRVDAMDKMDRTPLQWAVLNLLLNTIDVLLNNGADLAKFVFPTANQFSEEFEARQHKHWLIFDLELLSGTLDVVRLLRKRGYELERSDALTIMDVFAGHGLLKNSADLEERWYKNEEFAREADKIMTSMGLSFYELTLLVYERLARTFCQPWALDSLLTLTGYRLPILTMTTFNDASLELEAVEKVSDRQLQAALNSGNKKKIESWLRSGASPNFADKNGMTPLHIICQREEPFYGQNLKLAELFFKINGELNQLVQLDARNKVGDTPMNLALKRGHKKMFELLLRRGANPNLANKYGMTPLHNYCGMRDASDDFLEMWLKICDKKLYPVQIDAQEKNGNTPLLYALVCRQKKIAEFLLSNGADPNLGNNSGCTPLHLTCISCPSEFLEMIFKNRDDKHQPVLVDSRDEDGNTALHLSLERGKKEAAELLLRKGADPNVVNEMGSTPLHMICMREDDDDNAGLAEMFFKINDELNQLVEIDGKDKSGRTSLQYAVARLLPNTVDVLLTHGADFSKFIFPTADEFDKGFEAQDSKHRLQFNLKLMSGTLDVVGRLRQRGYELARSDALTIMDALAKRGLLKKSADLEERWSRDTRQNEKLMRAVLHRQDSCKNH